jgi:hypothetical protein
MSPTEQTPQCLDRGRAVGRFEKQIEEKYSVKYIGFYDVPDTTRYGEKFIREHVRVFYQPNPKTELGHTNYMGVIIHPVDESIWLCNAAGILDAEYPAYMFADGSYISSRYRHDYQTRGDVMLDGGIDYVRYNPAYPPNGYVKIVRDHEMFFRHGMD